MSGYAVIQFADGTKCYSGPNCMRHSGKQRLSAGFSKSELADKLDELDKIANNPLMSETPVEIDTMLAGIYNEYYKKRDETIRVQGWIDSTKRALDPNYRFHRESDVPNLEKNLAEYEAIKENILKEAEEIPAEGSPLETEFTRRGGWTRAFLVDNTNGHVHKNRYCSTCFVTTRYGWLPEYSGADEEKIVSDAGEKACTVCYPSAPVEVLNRPSVIELPDKKAARLAKEAAKAERDRKLEEKSIMSPNGEPLRLTTRSGVIKSARTAEIEAVDFYSERKAVENGKYGQYNNDPVRKAQKLGDYETLVTALAAKFGRTYEEQEQLIIEKGNKKYKREWE